jgi:hypothetical protein
VGDEVSRLWRRHLHASFPEPLVGREVAGVDLAAVAADIAGCVDTWRAGGGSLDEDGRKQLTRGIEDLDAAVPLLTSRVESLYFDRIRHVATLILDS